MWDFFKYQFFEIFPNLNRVKGGGMKFKYFTCAYQDEKLEY